MPVCRVSRVGPRARPIRFGPRSYPASTSRCEEPQLRPSRNWDSVKVGSGGRIGVGTNSLGARSRQTAGIIWARSPVSAVSAGDNGLPPPVRRSFHGRLAASPCGAVYRQRTAKSAYSCRLRPIGRQVTGHNESGSTGFPRRWGPRDAHSGPFSVERESVPRALEAGRACRFEALLED